MKLEITSLQAPNQDVIIRGVAAYLSRRLQMEVAFAGGFPWQERERRLDRGEIELGWICGLPYVRRAARADWPFELLAAPVMAGSRYGAKPVYFSDVVVRRASPFRDFADLRGASWAFNEPNSHSGYGITRYQLARLGETGPFWGRIVEAGSHERALQMVLSGQVDASAIDSTVLELEMSQRPALMNDLRIIDRWGPSPSPPLVISRLLAQDLREAIRDGLLTMHQDPWGRRLLMSGLVAQFAAVTDHDYDAIREMDWVGRKINLAPDQENGRRQV